MIEIVFRSTDSASSKGIGVIAAVLYRPHLKMPVGLAFFEISNNLPTVAAMRPTSLLAQTTHEQIAALCQDSVAPLNA